MSKKKEVRTLVAKGLKTRGNFGTDEPLKICGYASVFNSPTMIDDFFTEEIAPGAFSRTILENDVRALFNHNWDNVLGRMSSGTLELREDEKGLYFEATLPDTTIAKDLAISIERGDVNQCSFGFYPSVEEWNYDVEPAHRRIIEAELFEISIVTIPAYEDTEVSLMRSKFTKRGIEKRKAIIKKINKTLEGTK